ncbi:MAG: hypothetical protein VX255_16065 [Candidatus Latescibacterota bacterium]|nr:hypothetical protein [Candidatus Latescibacterota bacterium]
MRRLALIVTLAVILHPIHAEATDLQTVKERTVDLLSGGRSDGAHRSRAQADLDDRVQRIVEADREPLTWEDPAVGGQPASRSPLGEGEDPRRRVGQRRPASR